MTLKRHKVTLSATGAAKKSRATFALPYSLSRWDFTTRHGDVAHFAKHTGIRFKRGKRAVAVEHARLIMDTSTHGYVTALIANERVKVFTVSGTAAKSADSTTLQQISGLRLKLTQAGANYVNRKLERKALRRFSQFGTLDLRLLKPAASGGGTPAPTPQPSTPGQGNAPGGTVTISPDLLDVLPALPTPPAIQPDLDQDGVPAAGVIMLPLEEVDVALETGQGTISLVGGLILRVPALGLEVSLVNPQIVLGADGTRGLYALVNGVRVKIADLDTDTLDSTCSSTR